MKLEELINEDIELDMSPMIDMVFLLLIFFIVASNIVDQKVPVEVPSAYYAKVPEDTTGRFMVTVQKGGEIYVDHDRVSLDQLKERLKPELEADPKLRVLIRSDGLVRYKVNEDIMEACAELGATDMIFAAFEQ